MNEGSGAGPEVTMPQKPRLIDRFKRAVGLSPNTPPPPPPPSDTLRQIVQGADASWKGPGVSQDDLRLMGVPRAPSPGGQMLEETKRRLAEEARKANTQPFESSIPPAPAIPSSPEPLAATSAVGSTQAVEANTAPQPVPAPEAQPTNVIPFPKTPDQPVA